MRPDHLPPSKYLLVLDGLSLVSRFWRAFGTVGERGPAHGRKVMVIPGFLASDRTTLGLQRALAGAGFRVTGWGMGLNRGAHPSILADIIAGLERFGRGDPVILIGWSLGGIFAREIAKQRPELVTRVFTLGSPFSGDPRANNAWRLYERIAGHSVDQPPVAVAKGTKPPVPTIALWSRRDGMVAPASARGEEHESDERVELKCGHMAFATNGRVIREIVRIVRERTTSP
jgi:pimeloyl-ACP methyl ester carboxylesterase